MSSKFNIPLSILMVITLTGCWPFPVAKRVPVIRSNPIDKATLELTAPGIPDDAVVKARVHYGVMNSDCLATDYTRAIGGVKVGGNFSVDIATRKIASGRYRADLHRDLLKDQALYVFHEACRWEMQVASFAIDAEIIETHDPADRRISTLLSWATASISDREIVGRSATTTWCRLGEVRAGPSCRNNLELDDRTGYAAVVITPLKTATEPTTPTAQ